MNIDIFHIRPSPLLRPYPLHKQPGRGLAPSRDFGERENMWIFDSYFKGCVELWSRERRLIRASAAYPPSLCMHLKDPHTHREMIEAHLRESFGDSNKL